jgi:tripeptidyl-peptidase-1
MHVSTLLITTATLFSSLVAAANVIVEKRDAPPSSWKRSNIPLDASSIIPLRIGMRQSNLHHIEGTSPDPGNLLSYEPAPSNSSISSDELLAVSDPSSTSYGKHWTPARLASFFEPAPSTVRAVQNWLEEAGLGEKVSVSKGNLWVEVRVTVEEAERLLETRYEMYDHRNGESRLGGYLSSRTLFRRTGTDELNYSVRVVLRSSER